MQSSTTAGAGRSEAARRLRSVDCDSIETVRPPSMAARLVGGAASLNRGLARLLAGRRRRRRARLQGWMTMDPRDIGVTRTDLQAVLYAGVPIERLGARPASGSGRAAAMAKPCRRPCLRLVVADDLDQAA